MKLLILSLLAMCCAGADPTVADPAPSKTTTTAQAPINAHPYEITTIRTNPNGEQDLVYLAVGDGSPVDKGTEFVIKDSDTYLVSVRAVKPKDLGVVCRVIRKPYLQRDKIYTGDIAFVCHLKKEPDALFAPATDQALVPNFKSEGPFDLALCQDGSRLSPREWVVNPYQADGGQGQQREIRKRLAQSLTINLKETSLKESIKIFNRLFGVNIVLSFEPSEEPKVTLDLLDVPLYDHIGYLCETMNLFFRVDDHAVVILRGYHYERE